MFDLRPVIGRASRTIDLNLAAMHAAGRYIAGEQAQAFEAEFAAWCGSAHAVGTGSGTAALELCLRAAGVVHREQEVVVPANTSLFTAQAVLAAGASLRFADVDPSTLLLSAETVEQAWSPRTAAVIAVHLFGHACPVDALAGLCRARDAVLIQDACQAHGLRIGGRALTEFSPYTAYSFYPTKNLGCLGDGGAVVTSSQEIAQRVRRLGDGGRSGDQIAQVPAINSRLDEMQACYLRAFLPHVDHWTAHRRCLAAIYTQAFERCPAIRLLPYGPEAVHHLYVIRVAERDRLRRELEAEGIQTAVHYPEPLHQHPAFPGTPGSLVSTEEAAREIVSLPIGPHISEDVARHVAERVGRYCE
jgi:dTDP-3-amino-3,4,6-trideoxy-alpha-D-glucose transaminase